MYYYPWRTGLYEVNHTQQKQRESSSTTFSLIDTFFQNLVTADVASIQNELHNEVVTNMNNSNVNIKHYNMNPLNLDVEKMVNKECEWLRQLGWTVSTCRTIKLEDDFIAVIDANK